MAGNVIVKLLPFKMPNLNDTGAKNARHVEYIGKRPGADRTVSPESLHYQSTVIAINNLSPDDRYLLYTATRPGVDMKGVHGEHLSAKHGLFGEFGVPDISAVTREIRSLRNSPMYRIVVSLDEKTAGDLGFDSKERWEILLRKQADDLAKNMLIPREDLRWFGAVHWKDGHPHAHLTVWDRKDRVRYKGLNTIPLSNLNALRASFTKAIYEDKRVELYAVKNAARDMLVSMAKDDTEQLRDFLRKSTSDSPSIAMPAPSNNSLLALSTQIKELSDMMPDRGRIGYAFMPEAVKAKVDAIVLRLLANPIYSAKLRDITESVRSLTSQFTLKLDKIDSATNKAEADVAKRLAQQILKTASAVKQDSAKVSIHMSLPSLMHLKFPIPFHEQEAMRFLRCLAAAGVERQAAIEVCKATIEFNSITSCCRKEGLSDNTAVSLVDHAFKTTNGKLRADDWKRVSKFIEEAEAHTIAYEEKAERQALLNASMSLMQAAFKLLQHPRGQHSLHALFEKGRTRKRRDALYTRDELE